jgi:N-acyl-phosphatidylethanolamine-hydrolysing phospholipase D
MIINKTKLLFFLFHLIYLEKRTRKNSILSSSTLVLFSYYYDFLIFFILISFRSRRTLTDTNKSLWGGYAIWSKNYKFYFAGDTGYTHNISIFKQIGKKYGPFDLSAIPIGAYEPRWIMEPQHVSPDEAVQIHIDTQSKKSIGIHWGTWALAYEPYLEPIEKLKTAVENNKLSPESFIVVKHGEFFDLPENN